MSPDGSDESEGDDGHDDDGLEVGAEGDGDEDIHDDEGEEETDADFADAVVLVFLFAFEGVADAGEFGGDFFEDVGDEACDDFVGVDAGFDVGGDFDGALAVGAFDDGGAASGFEGGDLGEWDFVAGWGSEFE